MEFNIADLWEALVDEVPDRLALVAGDTRLSYAQLDERANRLAHHLEACDIGERAMVGIHAHNCAEWVEAMFAAYKVRAVPVNVNYRYVEAELRHLYEDADLVAVVAQRQFCPRISAIAPGCPMLRHVIVIEDGSATPREVPGIEVVGYDEALAAASPERGFPPRSADDRYVIYTGGTTGMPKGVVWRHEDIFFAALGGGDWGGPGIEKPELIRDNARAEFAPTLMVNAPLMHGGGQWVLFYGVFAAGTVVLYTGRHFDAHEVLRIAERERVTSISVIGDAMARPLAEALAEPGVSYDLSALIAVGSGGAILSPAVREQLRAHLPEHVMILDSFGASETGAQGSVADKDGPRFTMGEETTVLDEGGRPVEPGSGQVGRLARRGRIPLEYYKDPEKTAETFVEIDGVRWVFPGDGATVDADGTIVVLGRGSVSINTGGEKVFPEEVEAALKSHPDVFDAVVVGVPDERFGERVVAVLSARPGRAPTLGELREHCHTQIAGYKAPRQVHLVDEVVRTPVGKPDYRWAKAVATGATLGERDGGPNEK